MFTLIAMGVGVAWLYSAVATIAPQLFPDSVKMDGAVPVYFEAAAIITGLALLGQVLELRAREQADAGIAMGSGTVVAIESADVALLRGDLMGIVHARRLSRATMRNIRQNLFFAFIYNGAGVPVAAGVLYPMFGLLLSPALAATAMALSSVSVIGNALRLRSARIVD